PSDPPWPDRGRGSHRARARTGAATVSACGRKAVRNVLADRTGRGWRARPAAAPDGRGSSGADAPRRRAPRASRGQRPASRPWGTSAVRTAPSGSCASRDLHRSLALLGAAEQARFGAAVRAAVAEGKPARPAQVVGVLAKLPLCRGDDEPILV